MGLRSRSDVANAAFLHAVELTGIALLSPATKLRFGIKWYCRYVGNLLFMLEPNYGRIAALKKHIETKLEPYKAV